MKLAIDYTPALREQAGIGIHVSNLAAALVKAGGPSQVKLFVDDPEYQKLGEEFVYIPPMKGVASGLRWMHQLKQYADSHEFDLILSTTALTFPALGNNITQIVFDVSPLTHPHTATWKHRLLFRLGCMISARRAKALIHISESSKHKFLKLFPSATEKHHFVSMVGVTPPIKVDKSIENEIKSKLDIPKHYLLSISTLQPRKNYVNMIRAFAKFYEQNPNYQYLIAGKKGWYFQEIFDEVDKLGLTEAVRFLGFVSNQERQVLLNNASCFMYVSQEEGFGIPNLEAYQVGTPVVSSNIEVITEVMGDAIDLVDPYNVNAIAEAIGKAINEDFKPDPQLIASYNWEEIGKKTWMFLKSLS